MRSLGYRTPAEIGRALGVATSTVYGWVARGVLPAVVPDEDDDPALAPFVRTAAGNVWVLLESAKQLKPDPADLARAAT